MEDIKYMVRVSCLTFNHAHYIEDAMNGFCMQETNFPFVCTIMDDCSTDGEQDVIKGYLEAHFDLEDSAVVRNEEMDDYYLTFAQHKTNKNCYFAVLFLKYNHYSIRKPKKPYIEEWCDTKYVAICEGDDYWIDKNKLQEQTFFLDNNPDYGMCYGRISTYNQEKRKVGGVSNRYSADYKDLLLNGNHVSTVTVMFRGHYLDDYNREIGEHGWKIGDYPLWLYISQHSKVHFEDKVYATYRLLNSSASHHKTYSPNKEYENSVFDVRHYFATKYCASKEELAYIYNDHEKRLFHIAYKFGEYDEARRLFSKIKKNDIRVIVKYLLSFIF